MTQRGEMQVSEDLLEPLLRQRILRREWKRNKPHLPKSTSLPILQLVPIDRPLFTCHQCGFTNTLIPLCLWCCWTSDAAHHEFELSTPRPRRVSAPPRVFWKQATISSLTPTSPSRSSHRTVTSKRTQPNATETQASFSMLIFKRLRSSDNATTKDMLSGQYALVPIEDDSHAARCSQVNLKCEAHHKTIGDSDTPRHTDGGPETVAAGIVRNVVRATSLSAFPAFDKPRRTRRADDTLRAQKDLEFGGGMKSHKYDPHRSLRYSRSSPGVDRPSNAMHVIKTLSTKSLRSTHIVIDFSTLHESYDLIKHEHDDHPPASPKCNVRDSTTPSQKTLRRMKRFRKSSPTRDAPSVLEPAPVSVSTLDPPVLAAPITVAQRPQSNPYLDCLSIPSPEPSPNTHTQTLAHMQTHTRAKSQPHPIATSTAGTTTPIKYNPVRLGHPSRPYYTAIRPNMSRPTSAVESFHPMSLPFNSMLKSHPSTTQRPVSLPAPAPAPAPSRGPSPGIFSVPSSTSAPDLEFEYPPPRPSLSLSLPLSFSEHTHASTRYHSPFTFAPALPTSSRSRSRPGHHTGFSLSGETELRMALARERAAGEGDGEVFRFREMGQGRESGRGRGEKKGGLGDLSLMKGVERLRRGLKDLVMGRVS